MLGRTTVKLLSAAVVTAMLLLPVLRSASAAESWPTRPVRIIVTLGAGSGVDLIARLFAEKLSARWGQPVLVENRPGGDGMVAITAFLGAHDDHVLLLAPVSSFTAHPYFHDKLPYDPKNLVPVARTSNTVVTINVPAALNVNSLKELVALARAKPGQLNWATGTGFTDFIFAGFLHRVGLSMAKVPYKNPVAAANDLAAGRIQVFMAAYAIVRPQVLAGKVKMLAVTNQERAPALSDVPTVIEEGYPSVKFDGLAGFFASPEMAAEVRARIADDVRTFVADPLIAQKMIATGQTVSLGTGAEFAASIAQQEAQVAEVAKLFGNKPVQ
ncbi:MAG TPA: tripartite tricarboxylate transporter substrate binding protein [Pseudolabrys sp.]|nr:tripartite tricarboxylate transporter substrate binding protein [Pseudolabrys sp.]